MASKEESKSNIGKNKGSLNKNLPRSYAFHGHLFAPRFLAGLPLYTANTFVENAAPGKNSYLEAICILNDILVEVSLKIIFKGFVTNQLSS